MTRIDTSRYFNIHMKQPKGRGYWMFEDKTGGIMVEVPYSTYAEAKKIAEKFASENRTFLYTSP
jgi:hypothetical protein